MKNSNPTQKTIPEIVEGDLKASSRDFIRVVWPEIRKRWFNGEKIYPAEAMTKIVEETKKEVQKKREKLEVIAELFDTLSGIDYWVLNNEEGAKGLQGVASRIQWMSRSKTQDKPYNTFTVRCERKSGKKTEFQKRREAVERKYLSPFWTIQGYLDKPGGKLLTVAMVRTKDLVEYIDEGKLGEDYVKQKSKDNGHWALFYAVRWEKLNDYLKSTKRKVKIIDYWNEIPQINLDDL